jgi:hypothetical protein
MYTTFVDFIHMNRSSPYLLHAGIRVPRTIAKVGVQSFMYLVSMNVGIC